MAIADLLDNIQTLLNNLAQRPGKFVEVDPKKCEKLAVSRNHEIKRMTDEIDGAIFPATGTEAILLQGQIAESKGVNRSDDR